MTAVNRSHLSRCARAAIATAALAALTACANATPSREIRMEAEGEAPLSPLCQRMADDFELGVTEGTLLTGRTFSRRFLDSVVSSMGVSFSFNVTDADPAENCRNTERGVECQLVGPAQILIRTPVGVAQYQVADYERVTVWSEGATLSCRELPVGARS